MIEYDRRRTTYRTFRLVRPTRVVRSPQETVAVWRPRMRTYAVAAVGWIAIAAAFARSGDHGAVVDLPVAAAVLCALVAAKAAVLVNRHKDAGG
jgi:hypothetical protein